MQETAERNLRKESSPKPHPLLLSADLSYNLTNDTLHYFGVNGIRHIAAIEAPEIFREMKSLTAKQLNELSDLIESKTDIPSGFFESLNLIYLLRGKKTFNHLDKEEVSREEGECDGEFLCRVLSQNRLLFIKLSKRLEGNIQSDNISFNVSRLTKPAIEDKDFFANKAGELEEQCKRYFKEQQYTDHCILKLVSFGNREGFQIERGSPVHHLPVLEKKERITRPTIIRKVDTVFYDQDTGTLWVYAKGQRPRDIAFYQMIAAQALTGNSGNHQNLNLKLNFVKNSNLKKLLDKEREYAERIILKKAFFPAQANSCISSPLKASGARKECLTEKKDFVYHAQAISSFSDVELKIVINEDEGIFDQITIGSGRIQLGGQVSIENVFNLISDLGVVEKHYNA